MIKRFFSWFENVISVFPTEFPEKPPASLMAFIWHYAKPFKWLIVLCFALSASIAMLEVYVFSHIGYIVDWMAESTSTQDFWSKHKNNLLFLSALVLIILPIIKFVFEVVLHQGLLGNMPMYARWQMHRYLLRQSLTFFQNDFAGRIAAKLMQTALSIRESVVKLTEVMTYVGVYFLSALVLFFMHDWRLALPMVGWLLGYIFVLRYFVPRLRDISQQQAEARSMVTGRIVDSYSNITTVKMFAEAKQEDSYAREGMDAFLDTVYRQMRLATMLTMSLTGINALLLFSVAALAIWLWGWQLITAGAIAFAIALVLRIQGMSHWILWEISGLFENIGIAIDGAETVSQDIEIVDKAQANAINFKRGEIQFDKVYFNYGKENDKKSIIENLNLTIHAGEKIGIVGRSGSGKSTLVNLLLRFYDLEQGSIRIDNQNICDISQASLRQHVGMVTQDTSLLHRSVKENIGYSNPQATLEQIVEVAKQAHAHEFICELEDHYGNTGYNAQVGERGVKLSGGQRQRIGIARVLLKNAPILILDEATSALDSEVEVQIQQSLKQLMHGKTVIAIAHRLSTIAAMDRLIVMDQGKIIEQGTHRELLHQNGLYAQLWQHQSGGFLAFDDEQERVQKPVPNGNELAYKVP